jgi:hypothetical protein
LKEIEKEKKKGTQRSGPSRTLPSLESSASPAFFGHLLDLASQTLFTNFTFHIASSPLPRSVPIYFSTWIDHYHQFPQHASSTTALCHHICILLFLDCAFGKK